MKITVHTHPVAFEEKVERVDENIYHAWTKAPPRNGLANMSFKNNLADYFKISHTKVRLISGYRSKVKIFEIFT